MADEEKKISSQDLPGIQQAAVFLMSVGEEEASEILKHLEPREVLSLGEAIATMKNVDKDVATGVLHNFNNIIGGQTALGVGSEDYLRNILKKALGKDKAGSVIDRILLGRQSKGLEALKWMEPRAIAEVIRIEHPQIIAIVLSYLEADQAGQVLSSLPENSRSDIMMRIASLDTIQPAALMELDEILEKQFAGNENSILSSNVGGIRTAANILNHVEVTDEAAIMEGIKNVDEGLGIEIEDSMFVFANLVKVADRGIQALLREISSEILITALKGSDEAVKEKILKNVSKRAAEMLRDDLEATGPVKLSEVENAQREILGIARRMAEAGDIALIPEREVYV